MIIITIILGICSIVSWSLYFMSCRKVTHRECENWTKPELTEWDMQCMAYHESGHAVCSYFLPEREKLLKITIDPSEKAFGMIQCAHRQHHNESEVSLMSTITTFLAGRLAEEQFLGFKTTSAFYDFATARDIAIDMVTKFGMGRQMKKLVCNSMSNGTYMLHSECFRKIADEDVQYIIERAESAARKIFEEHKETVHLLASELLKKKTLSANEIEQFFNNKQSNDKKTL